MKLRAASENWGGPPAWACGQGAGPCWLLSGVDGEDLVDLKLDVERLAAGSALTTPDERPRTLRILLDGWAMMSRSLPDGRRQILSLMFAGDVGSCWTPLREMLGVEVHALTPCRTLAARADCFQSLLTRHPALAARAAERAAVDLSILQAWLVNVGQRKAPERIAHLFCELGFRLDNAGLGGVPDWVLPLTQQDLADALGMTSVHVNRVLQRLRADGLIAIRKGAVILRDVEALARICDFDPAYLRPDSDDGTDLTSSRDLVAKRTGTSS